MKLNKPQLLWFLLNRFDRDNEKTLSEIQSEQEAYPFFYLLSWNSKSGNKQQGKTALRSPLRSEYYLVHHDAPEFQNLPEINTSQNDIINEFLEKMPTLSKPKKVSGNEDSFPSEDLSESQWSPPISETFAIILVKQEKYQQAIEIYEKLILAKPEKRLYFATRISELKQNITE
jgi:hypothetical protein